MREFLAPVDRVQADKDSVGGGICRTNDKRKDGRKKGQAEKVGGTNSPTQKASAHKDRPQNKKQFAAEIADVTGVTKREVNKKIARADKLGADLHQGVEALRKSNVACLLATALAYYI